MSSHLALIPPALAIGVCLFAWFWKLARAGRHMTIVCFVLGLIVVETALYETIDVPIGLFHPSSGSGQVRTIDLIIVIALIATVLNRGGRPHTWTYSSFLWLVFGFWIVAEAVVGFLNGNSKTFIGYELKTVIYLSLFTVARRVPLRAPETRRSLERLIYFTAAVSGVTVMLGAVGLKKTLNVPGLRGAEIGSVGSIGATLFVAIGMLALAIAICSDERRTALLISIPPLFVPPLMAHQRASLLNLVLSLAALLVLLPVARHRLRATVAEGLLVLLAALALVSLPVFIGGVVESKRVIPFSHSLSAAISSGEKKLSAQDRVNQIVAARKLIAQRPVYGHGLGVTITYYEVGFRTFIVTYLTHNIITDLLLRTGLVGLVLFVLAIGSSIVVGIQTWRHASEPLLAATSLAAMAILAGWIGHGMVESLFEHVQLAPLFGITIGLIDAAARQRRAAEPAPEPAPAQLAPRLA